MLAAGRRAVSHSSRFRVHALSRILAEGASIRAAKTFDGGIHSSAGGGRRMIHRKGNWLIPL